MKDIFKRAAGKRSSMKRYISLLLVFCLIISLVIPNFTAFAASSGDFSGSYPVSVTGDTYSFNNISGGGGDGAGFVRSAKKLSLDGLQIVIDLDSVSGSLGWVFFSLAAEAQGGIGLANSHNGFGLSFSASALNNANSVSNSNLWSQTYHHTAPGAAPGFTETPFESRTGGESRITFTIRKDAVLGEWYLYINDSQEKALCLDEVLGRNVDDCFPKNDAWLCIVFDSVNNFSMDFNVNEHTAPGTGEEAVSYADFGGGYEVAGTGGTYNFDSARRINGIEVWTNQRRRLDGLQITIDLNSVSGSLGWMFFSLASSGQGGYFQSNDLNGFGWSVNAAALNMSNQTSTVFLNSQTYHNDSKGSNSAAVESAETARSGGADKIILTIKKQSDGKYYLYRDAAQTQIVCLDDAFGRAVGSAFPDGKAQMNITFDGVTDFSFDFTINELYNGDLGAFDVETIGGANYITGVEPKTSVGSFMRNTGISANVLEVLAANGEAPEINRVKTGTVVDIHGFGTASVVIKGDVSGNGIIDYNDLISVRNHLLKNPLLSGAYLLAGNINDLMPPEVTIIEFFRFREMIPGQIGEESDRPYGFSDDRFGAVDERYEPEAVNIGANSHTQEMRSFTNDQKLAQRTAAANLLNAVSTAVANGRKKVYIDEGYYRFGDAAAPAFNLTGINDLEIIGGPGVHFIQESNYSSVMVLKDCENVTVKGVTMDFENVLHIIQGTVQYVINGTPWVSIDPDYMDAYNKYGSAAAFATRGGLSRVLYFDKNNLTKQKVFSYTGFMAKSITPAIGGLYSINYDGTSPLKEAPEMNIVAGDKFAIPIRGDGATGVGILNCSDVTLEDVDIYYSQGLFGLHEQDGEGGNVFRRVRITRRPGTNRLMSAAADGYHSINVEKGALIEKCEFAYAEDDLLNIHSFLGYVAEILPNNEYEIVFPGFVPVRTEAPISVYGITNGALRGSGNVTAVTTVTDSVKINTYKSYDQVIKANTGVVIRDFGDPTAYRIKLDAALSGAALYDIVSCQGASGAGVVIKDSYFHDSLCSSILVTGPNALIKNNMMKRMGGRMEIDRGGFFSEGPFPSGITVEDNLFEETNMCWESQLKGSAILIQAEGFGSGSAQKDIITDIVIRNNEFLNLRSGVLYALNTRGLTFTGNTVNGFFSKPLFKFAKNWNTGNGTAQYYGVYLNYCKDVTVAGNTFSGRGADGTGDVFIDVSNENVTNQ